MGIKYSGGKTTRRRARGNERKDEKHIAKRIMSPKRTKKSKSASARGRVRIKIG